MQCHCSGWVVLIFFFLLLRWWDNCFPCDDQNYHWHPKRFPKSCSIATRIKSWRRFVTYTIYLEILRYITHTHPEMNDTPWCIIELFDNVLNHQLWPETRDFDLIMKIIKTSAHRSLLPIQWKRIVHIGHDLRR